MANQEKVPEKEQEFKLTFEKPIGKLWVFFVSFIAVFIAIYTLVEKFLVFLEGITYIVFALVFIVFAILTINLLDKRSVHNEETVQKDKKEIEKFDEFVILTLILLVFHLMTIVAVNHLYSELQEQSLVFQQNIFVVKIISILYLIPSWLLVMMVGYICINAKRNTVEKLKDRPFILRDYGKKGISIFVACTLVLYLLYLFIFLNPTSDNFFVELDIILKFGVLLAIGFGVLVLFIEYIVVRANERKKAKTY